jgi:hypothetical protein
MDPALESLVALLKGRLQDLVLELDKAEGRYQSGTEAD